MAAMDICDLEPRFPFVEQMWLSGNAGNVRVGVMIGRGEAVAVGSVQALTSVSFIDVSPDLSSAASLAPGESSGATLQPPQPRRHEPIFILTAGEGVLGMADVFW